MWRDSAALLRLNATDQQVPTVFAWLARLVRGRKSVLEESLSLRYMALGMASDQAKVEFFRSEHLPVPLSYLDDYRSGRHAIAGTGRSRDVASELWKATGTMASVLLAPDEDGER